MTWGIVGQERAVAALQRDLAQGRAAHAYLFVGPERVGKHTLALKLAQALNCDSVILRSGARREPSAATKPALSEAEGNLGGAQQEVDSLPAKHRSAAIEPCDACPPCRRIAAGLHADVQTVTIEGAQEGRDGEPAHKEIRVGQVREVERAVALKPYEGRARVVIIDPADAMNAEAQNAFLKTLEEPPPQVTLVLVSAQEQRLLPTIRSRCRQLALGLLPLPLVAEELIARGVEAERAQLLARLSRGRIGWALAMAADDSLMARREEWLEEARSLAAISIARRWELAERLASAFRRDRESVLDELAAWQDWWRDVLVVQSEVEEGAVNADRLDDLRHDASRYPRGETADFVRELRAARRYLQENVQPRLVLESLLLGAPAPAG